MLAFWGVWVWTIGEAIKDFLPDLAGDRSTPIAWAVLAVMVVFVLIPAEVFGKGIYILVSRARFVIFRDRVVGTEMVGPVRWWRTVRFAEIAGLEVIGRRAQEGRRLTGREVMGAAFRARLKQGKKTRRGRKEQPVKYLLWSYPRDWLEEIAAEVAVRMKAEDESVEVEEGAEEEVEESGAG
jgi:hypothetical protein